MNLGNDFEILTGSKQTEPYLGGLARAFHLAREIRSQLGSDIGANLLQARTCLKFDSLELANLDVAAIVQEYPIELISPFENVKSVSGGVWKASDLFDDRTTTDAMLKLRFQSGTTDLPMHAHEHSDRVIFVAGGHGSFHVSSQSVDDFDGTNRRHTSVQVGNVLAFSRGVVHTFRADESELVLLSYHFPFIALDDPRQYTIARVTRSDS